MENEPQLTPEEMLNIEREMFMDSFARKVDQSDEEYQAQMKQAWG